MDPVFASAILSELLNTKDIKMSHMKIGSSPMYLIPGQEKKLEDHVEHLKSIEKEAYLKLRETQILIDKEEEPKIRVALRNLKDFAKPFKLEDKIAWRYAFTPESEIKKIIDNRNLPENLTNEESAPKPEKETLDKEEDTKKDEKLEIQEPKPQLIHKESLKKIEPIFHKETQDRPKPEFLNELRDYLVSEQIEFLEEIKTEKKEIVAKVSIKTTLGDINFLLIAKNKMTISKEEINSCLQQGSYNSMPCLLIIRKEPPKNIKEMLQNNYLIRLKVM